MGGALVALPNARELPPASGLGLREAKTIIEELIESQRMNLPSR
jgi:hypothetical protein